MAGGAYAVGDAREARAAARLRRRPYRLRFAFKSRAFIKVRAGGRGRSCIRSGLLPKTDLSGGHVACMALRSRDTDVTEPWSSGGRILESDVDTLCLTSHMSTRKTFRSFHILTRDMVRTRGWHNFHSCCR